MVVSMENYCHFLAVYGYLIIYNLPSSVGCDAVVSSSAGGATAEDVDMPGLALLDPPLALPLDD